MYPNCLFDGFADIEKRLQGVVIAFCQKNKNMPPSNHRYLRSNLLRKNLFWEQFIELTHFCKPFLLLEFS